MISTRFRAIVEPGTAGNGWISPKRLFKHGGEGAPWLLSTNGTGGSAERERGLFYQIISQPSCRAKNQPRTARWESTTPTCWWGSWDTKVLGWRQRICHCAANLSYGILSSQLFWLLGLAASSSTQRWPAFPQQKAAATSKPHLGWGTDKLATQGFLFVFFFQGRDGETFHPSAPVNNGLQKYTGRRSGAFCLAELGEGNCGMAVGSPGESL